MTTLDKVIEVLYDISLIDEIRPEMTMDDLGLDEIGQATLMRQDKAITFMRWIRKAIDGGTFINIKTQNDEQ